MEESGHYTVIVAVVGTARVTVYADSEQEAMAVAEACITPLHVHEWSYVSDEIEVFPIEQPQQRTRDFDADPA